MNILVVQNFELTPLGVLSDCVTARGGHLDTRIPTDEDLPVSSTGFDGLIVLGGPMHAEDDAGYPHLLQTIALIHQFQAEHKPILGICLGAQILARAFGKRVYKHNVVEIGFTPIFLTDAAAVEDPLLSKYPQQLYLMQWHFDTFDLPEAATLLMYGEACQNQAYRIGDNIYGFQVHFEVTREIVQSWIEAKDEFIAENYPDLSECLTEQIDEYIEDSKVFGCQVGNAWSDLVEARMHTELSIVSTSAS